MHQGSFVLLYNFRENWELQINVKNAFGVTGLYPINNVANDVSLAAGTPSYEMRTFWMNVRYQF